MARTLQNVKLYIATDKDGVPQNALMSYKVADGVAVSKQKSHTPSTPDWGKTLHNTGVVGEFLRDELDVIKTNEGIV